MKSLAQNHRIRTKDRTVARVTYYHFSMVELDIIRECPLSDIDTAAKFGACQFQFISDHPQKLCSWFVVNAVCLAVQV